MSALTTVNNDLTRRFKNIAVFIWVSQATVTMSWLSDQYKTCLKTHYLVIPQKLHTSPLKFFLGLFRTARATTDGRNKDFRNFESIQPIVS